jgi:methylmalonyl-CoA mutase cobalamin-binding subunit
MKRLIGVMALVRAARLAPKEIADIAQRESKRQIDISSLESETPPEVEKLRDWLHAEKMARARKKLKH